MLVSQQRNTIPAIVVLITGCMTSLTGCTSSQKKVDRKGFLISASLPLKEYVKNGAKHSNTQNPQFYFPQLNIYDESERLVYSSHNNSDNVDVLAYKLSDLRKLQPVSGGENFADIVEEMTEFRARKQEILQQGKLSVLSIFLEDCHACSLQEEALSGNEDRLLDEGINVLVVHVMTPHNPANPAEGAR